MATEFEEYQSAISMQLLPDGLRQMIRNGYLSIHFSVAPRYVRCSTSLDATIPRPGLRGV